MPRWRPGGGSMASILGTTTCGRGYTGGDVPAHAGYQRALAAGHRPASGLHKLPGEVGLAGWLALAVLDDLRNAGQRCWRRPASTHSAALPPLAQGEGQEAVSGETGDRLARKRRGERLPRAGQPRTAQLHRHADAGAGGVHQDAESDTRRHALRAPPAAGEEGPVVLEVGTRPGQRVFTRAVPGCWCW